MGAKQKGKEEEQDKQREVKNDVDETFEHRVLV